MTEVGHCKPIGGCRSRAELETRDRDFRIALVALDCVTAASDREIGVRVTG
jgi:hypothetical protein